MGSKRFSGLAVLMSVLGAGIAYLIGEMLFKFGGGMPDYLKVGLYFGLGAMMIAIMVFASQKNSPQLIGYRWKDQYFKTSLKFWVPVTLLMVGLAAGILQGIYGLEINKPKIIDHIVIAVDKSSSMTTTDPEGERYKAICDFIDHLKGNKQVALISFNEEASVDMDFTSVSTPVEKESFKSQLQGLNIQNDGQTGIRNVMNAAYSLIEDKGVNGSLILVSDGAPTDDSASNLKGLVQQYVDHHIPVYTIGMMYTDPSAESYLQEIADMTEGKYYSTSDTTMLKEVFNKIRYNAEKGTLVSPRTGAYMASSLHQILRIVFLVIIALMIALALGIMFDNKYLVRGMMIGALVGGIIGSVLTEKLFVAEVPAPVVRAIYWGCVGLALMSFTWCITFREDQSRSRQI